MARHIILSYLFSKPDTSAQISQMIFGYSPKSFTSNVSNNSANHSVVASPFKAGSVGSSNPPPFFPDLFLLLTLLF